jgi:hypothetical protein
MCGIATQTYIADIQDAYDSRHAIVTRHANAVDPGKT